ncbi:MAG: hypothetical protein U5S82_14785 [Gammaproteobacteria bacterium]|nr:hypothetical protein [Gammaproteobacteria bacterium]
MSPDTATPKKVGSLPVTGSDALKRTNEIGMAIPLLAQCEIAGRDITADALLTQRALAAYIVERQAHYHFTVKGNQPTLANDIALHFERPGAPDFAEPPTLAHGRIETRRIWASTALNGYLDFPHVGQVFLIEREVLIKKTAKRSCEIALGITSRSPQQASPERLLANQSRTLAHREHPLHHRLELRRGSQPHTHRLWPGERHAPAPLRGGDLEVVPETPPVDRANDAPTCLQLSKDPRLPAPDRQLTRFGSSGRVRTNLPWPALPRPLRLAA